MRGGARPNAGRKRGIGLTYTIQKHCQRFISEILEDEAIKQIATQELSHLIKEERKEKNNKKVGYVYLIESGGLIKIGYTSNFKKRLAQYNTHNSNVNIVGVFEKENAFLIESILHEAYEDFRVKGEWFDLPKDALCELLNYFNNGQKKI